MRDKCREKLIRNSGIEVVFREKEPFSRKTVLSPLVLRLDGVGFRRLMRERRVTPNDLYILNFLEDATREVVSGRVEHPLGARFGAGYIIADEVSLFIPYRGEWRVEKLVSTTASLFSSTVTLNRKKLTLFDCRVVEVGSLGEFMEYIYEKMRIGEADTVARTYQWYIGECPENLTVEEAKKKLEEAGIRIPAWSLYGVLILHDGRTISGADIRKREVLRRVLEEAVSPLK